MHCRAFGLRQIHTAPLNSRLTSATSGQSLHRQQSGSGPGTDRILIFQELGLFPWLTVGKNVEFGMKMKGMCESRAERKNSNITSGWCILAQFQDSYTHQLSGGMRQRVALARALATEPDVLLMDEPFAALDAQTRDLLHDELERIWAETGRTIIFVTHNVREAVRLGDRVALITFRPGRVKQEFRSICRVRDILKSTTWPAPRARSLMIARGDQQIPGSRIRSMNKANVSKFCVLWRLIGIWAFVVKDAVGRLTCFPRHGELGIIVGRLSGSQFLDRDRDDA